MNRNEARGIMGFEGMIGPEAAAEALCSTARRLENASHSKKLASLLRQVGQEAFGWVPFSEERLRTFRETHWLIPYPGADCRTVILEDLHNRIRANETGPFLDFAVKTSPPGWVLVRKGIVPGSLEAQGFDKKETLLSPGEVVPPARILFWTAYVIRAAEELLAQIAGVPTASHWPFEGDLLLSADMNCGYGAALEVVRRKPGTIPGIYPCSVSRNLPYWGIGSMVLPDDPLPGT